MRRREGMEERARRYLQMILDRLNTCRKYRPKFGTGKVITLEDFERMYGEDPSLNTIQAHCVSPLKRFLTFC